MKIQKISPSACQPAGRQASLCRKVINSSDDCCLWGFLPNLCFAPVIMDSLSSSNKCVKTLVALLLGNVCIQMCIVEKVAIFFIAQLLKPAITTVSRAGCHIKNPGEIQLLYTV